MWHTIPDYPAYEAHPDGRIRNRDSKRILTPWAELGGVRYHGKGYLRVKLGNRKEYVHRIILSTFEPPPSPRHHAAHKNHDSHDNRLENLHWRTHRENHDDSPDSIKTLTPDQARELWRLRDEEGMGWRTIARRMGLNPMRVNFIIRRGSYRDLIGDKG